MTNVENQKLRELKSKIKSCRQCPLYQNLQPGCNPVPGLGNADAKYLIVLPSVGYEEGIIGEPIGGINEDFFKKLFKLTKIDKNEVYFTSIIKCTGEPKSAEIKICKDWIDEELVFLSELKTIFTFGVLPTRVLLGLKTTFDFSQYVYKSQDVRYTVYNREAMNTSYSTERIVKLMPVYNSNYVIQRSQKEFDTLVENVLKGK